jgi:aryl-alcohol dehydrogenase-like predicted oxidoreductase
VTAIQTEYSLMQRDPEKNGVLATCEELGIGFVSWGPVGEGYLTGKIDSRTKFDPKMDIRSGFPRFSPENIAANMPIIDFLSRFAEKKTPPRLKFHWLGCSRKSHLLFRFPVHAISITSTRMEQPSTFS